jgi:hypothetical protein
MSTEEAITPGEGCSAMLHGAGKQCAQQQGLLFSTAAQPVSQKLAQVPESRQRAPLPTYRLHRDISLNRKHRLGCGGNAIVYLTKLGNRSVVLKLSNEFMRASDQLVRP